MTPAPWGGRKVLTPRGTAPRRPSRRAPPTPRRTRRRPPCPRRRARRDRPRPRPSPADAEGLPRGADRGRSRRGRSRRARRANGRRGARAPPRAPPRRRPRSRRGQRAARERGKKPKTLTYSRSAPSRSTSAYDARVSTKYRSRSGIGWSTAAPIERARRGPRPRGAARARPARGGSVPWLPGSPRAGAGSSSPPRPRRRAEARARSGTGRPRRKNARCRRASAAVARRRFEIVEIVAGPAVEGPAVEGPASARAPRAKVRLEASSGDTMHGAAGGERGGFPPFWRRKP